MKNERYTISQFSKLYNTNRMKVWRMVRDKKLEYDINNKGVVVIADNKWNKGVMGI